MFSDRCSNPAMPLRSPDEVLLDELEARLLAHGLVSIHGVGRFALSANLADQIQFIPAPETRALFAGPPPETPWPSACSAIVVPAARRARRTIGRMHHSFVALLDRAVRGAVVTGMPQPLGRLGLLRAERDAATATGTLRFTPSAYLRARIRGATAPAIAAPAMIADVLARPAARDAPGVRAALARLGFRACAAAADQAARVAALAPSGSPALLVLWASHRLDVCRRPPPCLGVDARVFEHPRTFLAAQEAHERSMRAHGEPPGVPFARTADGYWCYCACAGTSDPWVFRAGTASPPPRHRHDVRFSRWLAACLVVDEVDRAATGRLLGAEDVVRVGARILELVGAADVAAACCAHLPF